MAAAREGRPRARHRPWRGRLYAACDEGALVEVGGVAGGVLRTWPLEGGPDATFFNSASGLAHVAIGKPGLVQTIDPCTGESTRIATALGAKTTALAPPDRLYVFSPVHRGALVLAEIGGSVSTRATS